jgi:hypothetical protein
MLHYVTISAMTSQNTEALVDFCRERFEAPLAVADRELGLIANLAEAIGRALGEWGDLLARMELAQALDGPRARALVLETVFDETLAPPAWRVLDELVEAA